MTPKKNPAAVSLGRKGGKVKVSKGPLANKTPEQRAEWSAKMLAARLTKMVEKRILLYTRVE